MSGPSKTGIVMPAQIAPEPVKGSHVWLIDRELRRCRFQIGRLLPYFPPEWPAVLAEELRETVRRIDSVLAARSMNSGQEREGR